MEILIYLSGHMWMLNLEVYTISEAVGSMLNASVLLFNISPLTLSANRSVLTVICNLEFSKGESTLHENYYLFFVINNMFMPKLS